MVAVWNGAGGCHRIVGDSRPSAIGEWDVTEERACLRSINPLPPMAFQGAGGVILGTVGAMTPDARRHGQQDDP